MSEMFLLLSSACCCSRYKVWVQWFGSGSVVLSNDEGEELYCTKTCQPITIPNGLLSQFLLGYAFSISASLMLDHYIGLGLVLSQKVGHLSPLSKTSTIGHACICQLLLQDQSLSRGLDKAKASL